MIRLSWSLCIPSGATVQLGEATATVVSQDADKLKLANIQGTWPTQSIIRYTTHAYHIERMFTIFNQFWFRFWLRDTVQEEIDDTTWQTTVCRHSKGNTPTTTDTDTSE